MELLFLGDSLIEFCDWQTKFPAHRVRNRGIAGETVQGLLARLPEVTAGQAPDLVLIMSGTNNLAREDYGFPGPYEAVLAGLQTAFPAAILVVNSLLPSRFPWLAEEAIPRLNQALAALAARRGARFLNAYIPFAAAPPEPALFQADGVHLSAAGYELWAREMAARLGL